MKSLASIIFLFALVTSSLSSPLLVNLDHDPSYTTNNLRKRQLDGELPVVVLHGMGDSCFNSGMVAFAETVSTSLGGITSKCIPLGDTQNEDTIAAFSLTMTEQVDELAQRLKDDPDYADGMRILGISQGALVARGYIQRYSWQADYPTADAFFSLHGPLMGVGKLPLCSPTDGTIGSFCNLLNTITGDAAYRPTIQSNLAQANYYRHPCYVEDYLETSFLPPLNFETDQTFAEVGEVRGLEDLSQLVMVKALQEEIVYPAESSWFGIYKDNVCSFDEVLTNTETDYYINDSFGLKTLNEEGKLFFETTPRGHVQISNEELKQLLLKYWT